jgi:retron-type reverse transcriptase
MRATDVARTEGVSNLQALQRVLYRSAKQDPTRRFHALYDKLTRSDVMWQAWVNVFTNQGAPGVDGVSVDSVTAGGMEGVSSFLDTLAAEVTTETYRPLPLRRVNIPKAGKLGETRPLGIPALRDRVLMSAAKLVLEPVFEADFSPVSFGFRPKRSAHDALEVIRKKAYPSECSRVTVCENAQSPGWTTPGSLQISVHGSRTMRPVWTTWTGSGGPTGSCARTAAALLRGYCPTAGDPAADAVVG